MSGSMVSSLPQTLSNLISSSLGSAPRISTVRDLRYRWGGGGSLQEEGREVMIPGWYIHFYW